MIILLYVVAVATILSGAALLYLSFRESEITGRWRIAGILASVCGIGMGILLLTLLVKRA